MQVFIISIPRLSYFRFASIVILTSSFVVAGSLHVHTHSCYPISKYCLFLFQHTEIMLRNRLKEARKKNVRNRRNRNEFIVNSDEDDSASDGWESAPGMGELDSDEETSSDNVSSTRRRLVRGTNKPKTKRYGLRRNPVCIHSSLICFLFFCIASLIRNLPSYVGIKCE